MKRMAVTQEQIRDALRAVIDPELRRDIVELEMVRSIDVHENGVVDVMVSLTTAGCPIRSHFQTGVANAVSGLEGVNHVNVGFDVYRIKTYISEHGSAVEADYYVDKRDRQTRKVRWEQLDEVLAYDAADLDRGVVAPDQIRTVLETYRDSLFTELFPGRTEVPAGGSDPMTVPAGPGVTLRTPGSASVRSTSVL